MITVHEKVIVFCTFPLEDQVRRMHKCYIIYVVINGTKLSALCRPAQVFPFDNQRVVVYDIQNYWLTGAIDVIHWCEIFIIIFAKSSKLTYSHYSTSTRKWLKKGRSMFHDDVENILIWQADDWPWFPSKMQLMHMSSVSLENEDWTIVLEKKQGDNIFIKNIYH